MLIDVCVFFFSCLITFWHFGCIREYLSTKKKKRRKKGLCTLPPLSPPIFHIMGGLVLLAAVCVRTVRMPFHNGYQRERMKRKIKVCLDRCTPSSSPCIFGLACLPEVSSISGLVFSLPSVELTCRYHTYHNLFIDLHRGIVDRCVVLMSSTPFSGITYTDISSPDLGGSLFPPPCPSSPTAPRDTWKKGFATLHNPRICQRSVHVSASRIVKHYISLATPCSKHM